MSDRCTRLRHVCNGTSCVIETARVVGACTAFMAPELFSSKLGDYDGFATDVYSLGVTLYNLVVGSPPFMAENELKLVEKVQTESVRFPTDVVMEPHLRY